MNEQEFGGTRGAVLSTVVLAVVLMMASFLFGSTRADARPEPGTASISGTLTSSGVPLADSCGVLYDSEGEYMRKYPTNSAGKYKFEWLGDGEYLVGFVSCGDNVVPEFYDDVATLDEASPVTVEDGNETPNIDADLASGGTVSGTVTDINDAPVYGICVRAFDADGNEVGKDSTDQDGEYSIHALLAGDVRIEFRSCGLKFASEFYDDEETLAEATPVPVSLGTVTPGIDAQLAPGGSISGTVTDSSKTPLEDIQVTAFDSTGQKVTTVRTDENGEYTAFGMATGDHRLHFEPWSRYEKNVAGEYYQDKLSLAEATPIPVTAGSNSPDRDVELAPGGIISGEISIGAGRPTGMFCTYYVDLFDSNDEYVTYSESMWDNKYSIDKLPTGQYKIHFGFGCVNISDGAIVTSSGDPLFEFYDNGATLDEATLVSVTSGEVTTVNPHLARDGSISGTVTDAEGEALPGVCVIAYDSKGAYKSSAQTAGDGGYTVAGLGSGDHRLKFMGCEGSGISVIPEFFDDGASLANATPIPVSPGSDTAGIDAEMAPGATIAGTVSKDTGGPLSGICVVAYGPDGHQKSDDRTDSEGEYTVPGLPDGDYRIEFADCTGGRGFTVATEYFNDKGTLAEAEALPVDLDSPATGIDAELATTPDDPGPGPGDPDPPTEEPPVDVPALKASITKLKVKGPSTVKRGKQVSYRVSVTNAGKAAATGVRLGVRGRGVRSGASIGKIPAGSTRTVKVKLKPRKAGKSRLNFKLTTSNAGGMSKRQAITVRK